CNRCFGKPVSCRMQTTRPRVPTNGRPFGSPKSHQTRCGSKFGTCSLRASSKLAPTRRRRVMARTLALALVLFGGISGASAQPPNARIGEAVPRDVREMYDRGLQFLMKTQSENGDWPGGQQGPGVTGLGLMAFLASGEDPNFGLY